MKKIFTGPIHSIHLKELDITENSLKLEAQSTILIKDALFYQNIFGKIVSFDYGTCLCPKDEAYDYLTSFTNQNKNRFSIPYINEEEITFDKAITKKEFKELKKKYAKK